MDPALWELLICSAEEGAREVEAIIRLDRPHVAVAGVRVVSRFGPIATCRVPRESILAARADPNVRSLKAPRLLGPEDEPPSRTIVVGDDRRRPPDLPLTGAGVVVGVVDWGCDFDHPNFKRRDGSTRLRALWDQRGAAWAGSPRGYGYGTVHGRTQIDGALATAEPYDTLGYHPADADRGGSGSHGTHVLDIAAGNGSAGGGPVGIAPDAELVFVHLADRGTGGLANLGDSVRILEAVDFIARTAGRRPWVVNLSVGRCGGPHDGSTLIEWALDAVLGARPGCFITQSAGNYFGAATHARGRLEPGVVESLSFVTDVADRTPNELEVWYSGEDDLAVGVSSPTGRLTSAVRPGERVDVVDNDRVVGRVYNRARDPNNQDNHIDLFLYPWAPAGRWTVTLEPRRVVDGVFHAWLERDEACPPCQVRFDRAEADTSCTTGTIANGHLPLVVGAYDAHAPTRALAPFSSAGPTRDGRAKPDVAAPGEGILAARSAPAGSRHSPGLVVRKSGTSMAAPHVAGTAALCMQAGVLAAEEIRAALLETAEPAIPRGDRTGCGYLDIARAVAAASAASQRRRSRTYLLPNMPTRRPRLEETEMEPEQAHATVTALGPSRLYRELVYRPGGPLSSWIGDNFFVLARPGEPPSTRPAAGDLLVRVPLGEAGPGYVAVLSDATLTPHHLLDATEVTAEREGPGIYATVIENGTFPRSANHRHARLIVDASGLMPPGQLLLRPQSLLDLPVQPPPVQPSVTAKDAVVVVPKPSTHPARRQVVLKTSTAFTGSGTFTVSKAGPIRFFDAAVAGKAVASGAVFTSAQLAAGVTIFAEGIKASDKVGDVVLTLKLTVDRKKGLSATKAMTAVELLLDLHASRTSTAVDPKPLTAAQKMNPGRFVHLQDAGFHHGRAMLTVRPPKPAGFAGPLVLRARDVLDANPPERLFGAADEVAAAGQAVQPLTVTLPNVPATGTRFWVEGARVSGALRDAGFQLGIDGVEPDGDRVALTVVQFSNLRATIPGTPPHTARLANGPVAAHVFTVGANGFDEDPTVNPPLPLLENSVLPAAPVALSVDVAPAGIPVSWGSQRANGISAAHGGDDAAAIVALHAAKAPTVKVVPGNDRQATLLADNTGTFHVRPFVDGNGNGIFDHHIDREPSMVLNLVLGRATLFLDSSIARSNQFVVAPVAGGGISAVSGVFNIANPGTAAIHMSAQVDVVTGGAVGRRNIDQFFGGWFNNVVAPTTFSPTYTDSSVAPAKVHPAPFVFVSNPGDATGPGGVFKPGDLAPALVAPPILDSGRAIAGTGGDSAALGQSRIRLPRTNLAVGERWIVEAVDSPGVPAGTIPGTHQVVANGRLTAFQIRIRFTCRLALWTNNRPSSSPTGDPADRLYVVLERLTWQMDGQWNITPATGAITQVTAPTCKLTAKAKTSPAVAAAGTALEVRPPAAVPLLRKDARA